MPSSCSTCDSLRNQVNALQSQNNSLQLQVNQLTRRVSVLWGGVSSTASWIVSELEKPTMPRPKVLPYLVERLRMILMEAQ